MAVWPAATARKINNIKSKNVKESVIVVIYYVLNFQCFIYFAAWVFTAAPWLSPVVVSMALCWGAQAADCGHFSCYSTSSGTRGLHSHRTGTLVAL